MVPILLIAVSLGVQRDDRSGEQLPEVSSTVINALKLSYQDTRLFAMRWAWFRRTSSCALP
jgi:hypothetical protein